MISKEKLVEFTSKFYSEKDLMHNLSHVNRILKMIDNLRYFVNEPVNNKYLIYGAYFHGCIKNHERNIINWLNLHEEEDIEKIISISKESLKENEAKTIEGKLLHDAHMVEGGKYFLLIKSLITGSLREQNLEETIEYFEKQVLNYGKCYIPEAEKILIEARKESIKILDDVKKYI